jgi:hypothetical protein
MAMDVAKGGSIDCCGDGFDQMNEKKDQIVHGPMTTSP